MWKNNKKYIILLINKYGDGTPIYKEQLLNNIKNIKILKI